MQDNKVSEKAIWEGSISPDEETSIIASPIQTQPQMMFCYKCNNVIPTDSKFCPCCQIQLYVLCPKCSAKYSSQYPACSQCGTNRREFLETQRREQEKIEARRREETLRQAKLEQEQREKERIRQEKLDRERQEKERQKRLAKEAYIAENIEIVQTAEYKSIRLSISEAWTKCSENKNRWDKIMRNYMIVTAILVIPSAFLPAGIAILALVLVCGILPILFIANYMTGEKHRSDIIAECLSNRGDYYTSDIIKMVSHTKDEKDLQNICIIAYRKKNGLKL